ncbi:MAG: stage II sporulation protein M [Clostridia bacterium]|nr:stage II sporulation protein M [Clostridia bacterium]
MFQFGKLRNHFTRQKFCYLLILILFIFGFFIGGFYANLSQPQDFSEALSTAEQFISSSKNANLNFKLLFSEEITPYLLILLSSLCIFGLPIMVFFIFKTGFSSGFFLAFLIKGFGLKGFFLGGLFLFVQVLFLLPALLIISARCWYTHQFLLCAITHRLSPKQSLKNELLLLSASFLLGCILVLLGVTIKAFLLPHICNYLFL